MLTPSSLLPTAVADLIALTFFDLVLKRNLADTMVSMSAQQIQVIAIFLSHLQRKPPKRVHSSERLYLIQQKPSYTPAEKDCLARDSAFRVPPVGDGWCFRAHPPTATYSSGSSHLSTVWGRLSFAEGSLGARRERTPFLGRGEKETHLRSPAANQCAFTADRETPLGQQLHARLAVLLSGPQHCTTRRMHHETDRCMRSVCDQRLER